MQRNILRTFNLQVSQKRYFKKQVRVRFAPSPTGMYNDFLYDYT